MERAENTFSLQNTKGYRLTIFSQLKQAIEAMHQPEELFQWLASIIVQRFDVSMVQLWSNENGHPGLTPAQLLATDSQNAVPPLHTINDKVAATVQQISIGQHISFPQPVERIFVPYVASLLRRYGLGYCAYRVIDRNGHSMSVGNAPTQARSSIGLKFVALLLLRYNHDHDAISTISVFLEQALVIAENCHLLLPTAVNTDRLSPYQESLPREIPAALPSLIPRRKQDGGMMLSSNPFARSVAISDKQALRLYKAIDSRKTVAELCRSIGMNLIEAQLALQVLLRLQQIEMYTLDGWPVDSALLFDNR